MRNTWVAGRLVLPRRLEEGGVEAAHAADEMMPVSHLRHAKLQPAKQPSSRLEDNRDCAEILVLFAALHDDMYLERDYYSPFPCMQSAWVGNLGRWVPIPSAKYASYGSFEFPWWASTISNCNSNITQVSRLKDTSFLNCLISLIFQLHWMHCWDDTSQRFHDISTPMVWNSKWAFWRGYQTVISNQKSIARAVGYFRMAIYYILHQDTQNPVDTIRN